MVIFQNWITLNTKNGLDGQILTDFTACARVKVYFLRGEKNFFVSYANNVTDDAFRMSIIAEISEDGTQIFQTQICKYQYVTQECVSYKMPGFTFNSWNHFCAVFSAIDRSITEVGVTMKLYINGEFVNSGRYPVFQIFM